MKNMSRARQPSMLSLNHVNSWPLHHELRTETTFEQSLSPKDIHSGMTSIHYLHWVTMTLGSDHELQAHDPPWQTETGYTSYLLHNHGTKTYITLNNQHLITNIHQHVPRLTNIYQHWSWQPRQGAQADGVDPWALRTVADSGDI